MTYNYRTKYLYSLLHLLFTCSVLKTFFCKLDKSEVQKLVNLKNDGVIFTTYNGESPVWKYIELVKVDNASVPFVKCTQCSCVLKWKSKDGTSGLSTHHDACSEMIC